MRLLAIALIAGLIPATAAAESPPPACIAGVVYPTFPTVPANLTGFVLADGYYGGTDGPVIEFYRRSGADNIALSVGLSGPTPGWRGDSWVITPTEPLEAGESYLVIETCGFGRQQTAYEVAPAVALPTTLGVTSVTELRSLRRRPGAPLEYFVLVGLDLSAEATAARALYEGQHLSDGPDSDLWRPLNEYLSPRRVPIDCGGVPFASPRTVTFSHQARQIGLEPSLVSESASVDIDCLDAVRVHPTADRPLTPEEIEEMDRIGDAGPAMDGGTVMDGGTGPVPIDGGLSLGGGGCSCRSAGRGDAPGWFGLLVFVAVLGRRLRR